MLLQAPGAQRTVKEAAAAGTRSMGRERNKAWPRARLEHFDARGTQKPGRAEARRAGAGLGWARLGWAGRCARSPRL